MEAFNNSIPFDQRMWQQDIRGSVAYARALGKCGLLTADETESLEKGLNMVRATVKCTGCDWKEELMFVVWGRVQVAEEWSNGTFEILPTDEDIHTANERRLGELVGKVAGKLHTGRRLVENALSLDRVTRC